ncbi:MAG TPA: tetratricopeptide repeat protein [Pirellulaceae bacterium]|nr:tetratricopeptide repeat protein [Pirellulaceae bacterium]
MERYGLVVIGFVLALFVHDGRRSGHSALGEETQQREGAEKRADTSAASRIEQLWGESFGYFKAGLYQLALDRKNAEFEAVSEAFPEGSWQRSATAAELNDFRKAAALGAEERAKLSVATKNFLAMLSLVREGRRAESVETGTKAVEGFTEVLGEDSALAVRTMGVVIRTCLVVDNRPLAEEMVARRLKACERTRASGDPEWLSAKLIVAEWDLANADRFWEAGPRVKGYLSQCPKDAEFFTHRTSALFLLSKYYLDLGDSNTALQFADEVLAAISHDRTLKDWQTIETEFHRLLCLVTAGHTELASEECARLDRFMSEFANKPENMLGASTSVKWHVLRAKVMVRLGRYADAEASLEKVKPTEHAGSAAVLFIEGELACRQRDFLTAELKLEASIKKIIESRNGDHPCILTRLQHLAEAKRQLGKPEEASQLDERVSRLKAKIAEVRR